MKRILYNFYIALEAVKFNRSRAILTALGIIFGVAAVIAMMAVGKGAKQELLEQIKLVGVNNIVIENKDVSQEKQESKAIEEIKYSPGLSMSDLDALIKLVPSVKKISPEIKYDALAIREGKGFQVIFSGVHTDFFSMFNLQLSSGSLFNPVHIDRSKPVCVIGQTVKNRLFTDEDPVGKYLKCGDLWLQVIGVLESRAIDKNTAGNLGLSANDNAVFIPWSTMLVRYFDRSRQKVETSDDENGEDSEKEESKEILLNQLDKIYMQVESSEYLKSSASLARRILLRRHNQQEDFNIIIPELILEQEERTRDVFNLVLVAIAAISLIVGGIGIMNIMLASVMERTKEIGIRLALGAKKKDVMMQFLGEAVFISISGGIIGILLGVGLSKLISNISIILPDQAGINTIISLGSVLVSFLVATGVGIIFGYAPARKAALQDPVVSLRYE